MELMQWIRDLKEDWDGEGAPVINRNAIRDAEKVVEMAEEMGFEFNCIHATLDGGVAISFINGTKYADIEFFGDDEAVVLMEDLADRDEIMFMLIDDLDETREALCKIREYIGDDND